MTDTLLVTSTAEGTGKTAIAIALGQLADHAGRSVGYMKPKGTRLRSQVGKVLDADPILAQEALGLEDAIETMEPVVYSSTFLQEVIRGGESISDIHAAVQDAYDTIAAERDLVMVEGGTDSTTGNLIDLTDADLVRMLDGRAVVVTGYDGVRGLDHIFAVAQQFEERLLGVLFNAVDYDAREELESDVIPYMESKDMPVLGVLPRERMLATVTVADLAAEIGADVLTECPMDGQVARFSVGAMSSDAALRHFRRSRDAVVITGGDRPGIQTAALEAPGIRGLVLTGGYRPSSRVIATAEGRDVPVMTVAGDTISTIQRVEDVLGGGRTRDVREIERMRTLLESHADTATLVGDTPG